MSMFPSNAMFAISRGESRWSAALAAPDARTIDDPSSATTNAESASSNQPSSRLLVEVFAGCGLKRSR